MSKSDAGINFGLERTPEKSVFSNGLSSDKKTGLSNASTGLKPIFPRSAFSEIMSPPSVANGNGCMQETHTPAFIQNKQAPQFQALNLPIQAFPNFGGTTENTAARMTFHPNGQTTTTAIPQTQPQPKANSLWQAFPKPDPKNSNQPSHALTVPGPNTNAANNFVQNSNFGPKAQTETQQQAIESS